MQTTATSPSLKKNNKKETNIFMKEILLKKDLRKIKKEEKE